MVTFGIHPTLAQVQAKGLRLYPDHVTFQVTAPQGSCPVTLPIPGRFSVSNGLGVIACCLDLGLPLEGDCPRLGRGCRREGTDGGGSGACPLHGAHRLCPYAGCLGTGPHRRPERCPVPPALPLWLRRGPGFHQTPRDGEVAASLADVVILTSDNPRTEDPEAILDQVAAGFPLGFSAWVRVADRRAAIRQALAMGRAGDVILLAGKGHETYQEVGRLACPWTNGKKLLPFSEKVRYNMRLAAPSPVPGGGMPPV